MSAWTVIGHTELGSAAATISFTSIPATYTDLVILISPRSTASGGTKNLRIKFNGSSSNFSSRVLMGTGAAGTSFTETNVLGEQTIPANTANTFSSFFVYIPNYTSTVAKSYSSDAVSENNATTAYQTITAGLWNPASNVAITSIDIEGQDPNLAQYTSATLYGVTKGSSGGVTVS